VETLLTSPALIDLILIFTMIELVVLIGCRRRVSAVFRREGRALGSATMSLPAIGMMLLPGVFLLLAVRAALTGTPWPWVPAALTAALVAHLLDLRSRWRG
jgi:hypothetical protein